MFRKVPFSLIAEQFTSLGIDLQRTGQKHYTALAMLAAANCEIQNKTPLRSAYFFAHAGRIFAQSALQDEYETHYFTAEEFVREASDAFEEAIKVYQQQGEFCMCATLYFELGVTLKVLGRYEGAGDNFVKSFQCASINLNTSEHSIQRQSNQLMATQLAALQQAAHCYVQTKDFELVTQTYHTLVQTIQHQLMVVQPASTKQYRNVSQSNVYNASESLLQKELIHTWVSHFIVLLIQKRNSEAKEIIDQLGDWVLDNVDLDDDINDYVMTQRQSGAGCVIIVQNQSKQGPQFVSFAQNVLPLYQDLFEACSDNQVKFITSLVEEQLQYYVDEEQRALLNTLCYVYENPLFLEAIATNQI
jgi:tetratricopeptide (TPR) repeat protein